MRWAPPAGVHIDRAACAWLIGRFVDPQAQFVFLTDSTELPADATPFDMPGVDLSHHTGPDGHAECSFETIPRRYHLAAPLLWRIGQIVHEADLDDERFDAPEARALDSPPRGLSLPPPHQPGVALTGPLFYPRD